MTDIKRWTWKLDWAELICSNVENKVSVKIYKEETMIRGKILDISMELFAKIAALRNGHEIIQQIVFSAEAFYYDECLRFESKVENT